MGDEAGGGTGGEASNESGDEASDVASGGTGGGTGGGASYELGDEAGGGTGGEASSEAYGEVGDESDAGVIVDETGAQRLLGYRLDVGRGDGRARCTLVVDDSHGNRHGRLHGGLAAVLLDNAMGATASLTIDAGGRRPFLTVSLNTQFLAPGRIGARLTATGRVTGGGRSLVFVDGELVDETGTLIATASGVFKRVRGAAPEGAVHATTEDPADTASATEVAGAASYADGATR